MNEIEKSWVAAALDFEGEISLRFYPSQKNRQHPKLFLGNIHRPLVERMAKFFGSNVLVAKQQPGRKTYYVTMVGAHEKVLSVLKEILPYLIFKKQRAERIIEFIEAKSWREAHGKMTKASELSMLKDYLDGMPLKELDKKHKFNLVTLYEVLARNGLKPNRHNLGK